MPKTRVWHVEFWIEDAPGFDDAGKSMPYLLKKDLMNSFFSDIAAGVKIKDLEFKVVGHRDDTPPTRRQQMKARK